jgi:hypothetical protein
MKDGDETKIQRGSAKPKNSCVLLLNLASDAPTVEAARPSAQKGATAGKTFSPGYCVIIKRHRNQAFRELFYAR